MLSYRVRLRLRLRVGKALGEGVAGQGGCLLSHLSSGSSVLVVSQQWLQGSGSGSKHGEARSPWQGSKVALSSHAKGGGSQSSGLAHRCGKYSGLCRDGQFPEHSKGWREIKGEDQKVSWWGGGMCLLAWGSECWKEGLVLGLSSVCLCVCRSLD